jgi:hypothetical protein
MNREGYGKVHSSKLICDNIKVQLVEKLLRQDMENQIWETVSSELSVKPTYDKEWITEELDLDDDEITVTITTKKGKVIEFTKKLEILQPSDDELREWDNTHDKEFISRMRHPPIDEVGGNSGVIR